MHAKTANFQYFSWKKFYFQSLKKNYYQIRNQRAEKSPPTEACLVYNVFEFILEVRVLRKAKIRVPNESASLKAIYAKTREFFGTFLETNFRVDPKIKMMVHLM